MTISKIIKIRSIVYGGLDGIITIFNLIAGSSGAKLNKKKTIIIGTATLIADAISMGVSDYTSTKASNKTNNLKENPTINAINTFISFVIFGLIPLLTFILINGDNNTIFKSSISTIFAMFILGGLKSKYTNENWIKISISTSFFGMFAACISYLIGNTIEKLY